MFDGVDADAATALAALIGARATTAFATLLVAAMLLAGLLWRYAGRRLARTDAGAPPAPALVFVRIAVGFAILVAAATGFAEVAEAIGEGGAIVRFDEALAQALAVNVEAATLGVFATLTRLADTATLTAGCIAIAAILLWRRRAGLAAGWVAAVAGNGLLNVTLKAIFERVRPVHEHGLLVADGWSFPSGHASGAVSAYGMLAYVLMRLAPPHWRFAILLGAVTVVVTVGISRVVLQVHFASDVVAGFLSGGGWLAVCIASVEIGRDRRRRRASTR